MVAYIGRRRLRLRRIEIIRIKELNTGLFLLPRIQLRQSKNEAPYSEHHSHTGRPAAYLALRRSSFAHIAPPTKSTFWKDLAASTSIWRLLLWQVLSRSLQTGCQSRFCLLAWSMVSDEITLGDCQPNPTHTCHLL